MNYWLITDTHLGHNKLVEIGARPSGFEKLITENLDRLIKSEDVLIHLGDVALSQESYWHDILCAYPCKKWLIKGNHDSRSTSWYLNHGWDFVGDFIGLNIFGHDILISHIPRPDSGFQINIHGHFHDTDHRKNQPEMSAILTSKHILLALEYNEYKPWNLRTVVEKFQNGNK